jgi:hypothetical protein
MNSVLCPRRLAISLLALLVVGSGLVSMAGALPLYASREAGKCAGCHFDPNGGGMRKDHGFMYAKNRHSKSEEEDRWGMASLDPQLNNWIRLGLDMRTMYVASHVNGGPTLATSTFFPMQGNLRVAITPHDKLSIVGSHGLVVDAPGFPTPYVARELYGLIHDLPHHSFVQIGRFRLPFGLRQDDHTSFVRTIDFLSYDSQKEDAGLSVGSVGKNGWFEFSFTNGTTPFEERAQTLAGKVAWALPQIQGAVSGFHRYDETLFTKHDRWSLYLTKTFGGTLSFLGEYAGGTDKAPAGATNSRAAFAEVDYRLARGINLRGKFDYFDPNQDGLREISRRALVDLDLTPVPFTEFKLSYRHYFYSSFDPVLESPEMSEFIGMLFVPF